MKPHAPSIINEVDTGIIDLVCSDADIENAVKRLPLGEHLRILDASGMVFLTTHSDEGIQMHSESADKEEIRGYLMAFAAYYSKGPFYDGTFHQSAVMNPASGPGEMFESYLRQFESE